CAPWSASRSACRLRDAESSPPVSNSTAAAAPAMSRATTAPTPILSGRRNQRHPDSSSECLASPFSGGIESRMVCVGASATGAARPIFQSLCFQGSAVARSHSIGYPCRFERKSFLHGDAGTDLGKTREFVYRGQSCRDAAARAMPDRWTLGADPWVRYEKAGSSRSEFVVPCELLPELR